MELEFENNRDYVWGFNSAYLLSEHEPQLLSDMARGMNPSNDFTEGFFAGKSEWEIEQSKDQLNEIDQLREQPEEQNRDPEEPKNELEELDQIREQSEEQDRDLEPE